MEVKVDKSEAIGEITKALAKAQLNYKTAVFDEQNTAFAQRQGGKVHKYASMRALQEATRAALTDNGLTVVQFPETGELAGIVTYLCHESGEWFRGYCALDPGKGGPQPACGAMTYAARYSYKFMTGVITDEKDDDGNSAQQSFENTGSARSNGKRLRPLSPTTRGRLYALAGEVNSELPDEFVRFLFWKSFESEKDFHSVEKKNIKQEHAEALIRAMEDPEKCKNALSKFSGFWDSVISEREGDIPF